MLLADEASEDMLPSRLRLWLRRAFALADGIETSAASTIAAKRRALERSLADILAASTSCDLARDLQMKFRRARDQLLIFAAGPGLVDPTNNACERALRPAVIQRNVLENPAWYTAYTPYQAEIAQGRLQALLNFQTVVIDLTGLPIANASLLDEGSAAAEACGLALASKPDAKSVFISDKVHPHVFDVIKTRMEPLGVQVDAGDVLTLSADAAAGHAAVVAAYPDTLGVIHDLSPVAERAHKAGALFIVCADLLALTLLKPPGEFGADICVGNSQRFGVPLGFGGPHAAFMSTRTEHARKMPGRIVGVSKDAHGKPAYRLAIQTREQHIKRDRATSNICTAQVLLAVMASMYAVYHGPEGLTRIARRVRGWTEVLAAGLARLGLAVRGGPRFDTLRVDVAPGVGQQAIGRGRRPPDLLVDEPLLQEVPGDERDDGRSDAETDPFNHRSPFRVEGPCGS